MSSPNPAQNASAAQASQALLQGFLGMASGPAGEQFTAWQTNSARFSTLQAEYFGKLAALWTSMLARERGADAPAVATPDRGDRRFAATEWRSNRYYDFLKQTYLINAQYIRDVVEAAEIDARGKERLRFLARQYIDAISPANFAATNPEALKAALETSGESLTRGISNLIADAGKGRITTTDETAFEVGRNVATAPGKVIFENDLIQVIQYSPATAKVRARPLLMVPPCINKYYILDLSPENSFVRYAVGEGNTVFMVSWRNITAELGRLTWDDYIRDGVIKAFEVVRAVTRVETVNALGFCVGGTLLAAALATLDAQGKRWATSLTLLTTLLDFTEVGEIGVFIDAQSIAAREAAIGTGGVMPGRELAGVFSALRANDLVWSYVVSNYLKGESPEKFDILYWNADSTNLPGPMYCFYVRNMYLENRLRVPGAVATCGERIDLGRLDMPAYILASREDHIVPWRGAYRSTGLLKGERRFVLGASGHIAGVVNPAAKNRRSFWTNRELADDPATWLAGAGETPGSWWTDWNAWLSRFADGEKTAPKKPGNAKFKPIEDAPGRYVKFRV